MSITDQIINMDSKASPAILASILDVNVSLLYQHVQQGIIPTVIEHSYKEHIQTYIRYYKKREESKLEALKIEKELKEKALESRKIRFPGVGDDQSMHPLMAAKINQDVRLGRAREEQLLQKNSIERLEYISCETMSELVEPLVISLRASLLSLSDVSKEHEKLISEIMESVYSLAVKLSEGAVTDAANFVKEMMEREIEFE